MILKTQLSRLGDTRSFFRVGAMQHAPSHQHKKKIACPMVSIFVSWDKNLGKYPKDTLILSLGQWSKIDSNQFCSIVPGTLLKVLSISFLKGEKKWGGDTRKRFRLVGWSMLHCTNAKKSSRVPTSL